MEVWQSWGEVVVSGHHFGDLLGVLFGLVGKREAEGVEASLDAPEIPLGLAQLGAVVELEKLLDDILDCLVGRLVASDCPCSDEANDIVF